jgi:hypothetical protein
MDIGALLVVLGLATLAAAYVARPLWQRQGDETWEQDPRISALTAARDRVLAALQELDMDFSMGKVPAEDYHPRRSALVSQGASVLRELDALLAAGGGMDRPKPRPGAAAVEGDLEAELEARVAELREAPRDEGGYCTQCGRPIQAGDRFCSGCGAPVGGPGA